MNPEMPVDRDQLEANANELRSRLADHLETLDQRIHDTLNIKRQVVRHPVTGVLIGAGALLAVAGGAGLVAYRARHRKLRHKALRLLGDPEENGWQHPQQGALPGGLTKELFGRVLVGIAAFVVTQLAKRALQEYVPQLRLPARPQ